MSERIYLDTNIYIDYFEERSDGIRPLDEFAFQLIKRAMGCEFEIVISDLVMEEIERQKISRKIIENLLEELNKNKKLIAITATPEEKQKLEQRTISSDHLHAILANRNHCKYLVTRNISHFSQFSGIINPILPENV